ncbi:MAG: class I SAM-dependent RNA methyltransferase [Lachnospiraceae bacterium]|jgi:putative N6-adenine-specific DNA methylase|nr:class I SAM-dependent RNA methyltransferase [Lachnospiraceae bacterium]
MEAVLKREIIELGYDITLVEDGRVTFVGDDDAVCRANIFLRSAERVLIKAGSFRADTFEDLFQEVKAIPWEEFIPKNGKFWVKKASSIRSKLFSPSDIQSIVKKAMVERMKQHYHIETFPEDGTAYPLRVFLNKDTAVVGLDTSGESLHKRGYRALGGAAPISETLAAAIILLGHWNKKRPLVDPFCGSGTFLIEAAMLAAGIAPGANRAFLAEDWGNLIPKRRWYDAFEEAREQESPDPDVDLQGYDIDPEVISIARHNASEAGVGDMVHFQQRAFSEFHHPKKYGYVITNPPYGERVEQEGLAELYGQIGERIKEMDTWTFLMITACEEAEKWIGKKADKNRKLYNGMMKTYLYQYSGTKPPKPAEKRTDIGVWRAPEAQDDGQHGGGYPEAQSQVFLP